MYHFNEKKSLIALFIIFCLVFLAVAGCITLTPSVPGSTTTPGLPTVNPTASTGAEADGALVVHFIDVGQGDSMLVQHAGKNMLIDAGTWEAGKTVSDYLKAHGVSTIDVLVSTHPHSDHIGGMSAVLKDFPVKVIYDSGIPHTTQTYEEYLTLIDQKNIKYKVPEKGDVIDFAPGVTVQVLSIGGNYEDLNEQSIVLKVTYGSDSFLFMGDTGFDAESGLLKSGYDLRSDVLKVGHHGSKGSSGTSFIKAVDPKYAVIEVGADNPYGHPTKAAMDRLGVEGSIVYRTDYDGDVVMTSDGKGVTVSAERRAPA